MLESEYGRLSLSKPTISVIIVDDKENLSSSEASFSNPLGFNSL